MAISGATKADALTAARKYGMEIAEMRKTLNVASVAPTVSAAKTATGTVTVSWTNIDGPYQVDIGDGVLRPSAAGTSSLVQAGVTNGTYTATVYGLGATKKSASWVMS